MLITTFFVTSADSATFVLGMQTSNGSLNPPNIVKVVWGFFLSASAIVLMLSGGLDAMQTDANSDYSQCVPSDFRPNCDVILNP